MSERLASKRSRLVLLEFLTTELMAARMTASTGPRHGLDITVSETPAARALKQMLETLGFPRPPDNITAAQLWEKVSGKVVSLYSSAPAELVGSPLMSSQGLTGEQWAALEEIREVLSADYSLRRQMLLTRLDATIQSFTWSERMKGREGEIGDMYRTRRAALLDTPDIGVPDLLAAREDLTVIEKVSSSSSRQNTRTSLNKVLIGAVPDRGGRTETCIRSNMSLL